MDFKKVLIGVAVIGVAYYFWNKSKKGSASSTEGGETSSANGAQLLAIAKNGGATGWNAASGKTPQYQCNCGAVVAGPALCAEACAGRK
jgi:hypothetical protein